MSQRRRILPIGTRAFMVGVKVPQESAALRRPFFYAPVGDYDRHALAHPKCASAIACWAGAHRLFAAEEVIFAANWACEGIGTHLGSAGGAVY